MKQFSLGKNHRLCAKIAVDRLFSNTGGSHTVMAYPLRAVWAENPGREKGESVQFLISIPKKRIRHAVDRVTRAVVCARPTASTVARLSLLRWLCRSMWLLSTYPTVLNLTAGLKSR